jgi:hypothetical protein
VGRACSTKRNAYSIFVAKPEGRRPLGRSRRKWVDSIKIGDRMCGVDLIDLAHDMDQWRALVNTGMNLRVPVNAGKFLSSDTTGGFSRRAQLHKVSYSLNSARVLQFETSENRQKVRA